MTEFRHIEIIKTVMKKLVNKFPNTNVRSVYYNEWDAYYILLDNDDVFYSNHFANFMDTVEENWINFLIDWDKLKIKKGELNGL